MAMSPWESLVGGYFAGVILGSIILGVVTVQAWMYYRKYPKDPMVYKFLVGMLWVLRMFQLVITTISLYTELIGSFGIPAEKTTWYNSMYQIPTVVSACMVQFFFVYRLYAISQSIMLPLLVAGMTSAQFGVGLELYFRAIKTQLPQDEVVLLRPLVIAWLTMEVISDLFIAGAMSFFLWRRRTGFPQTDTVIKILMMYAINTGLLTSIVAIEVMLVFLFHGFQFFDECSILSLGGLYTTSLLANLHSRSTLRRRLQGCTQSVHLSRLPEGMREEMA
jgi:hypothetical protein